MCEAVQRSMAFLRLVTYHYRRLSLFIRGLIAFAA
jgi:hypothetical protein